LPPRRTAIKGDFNGAENSLSFERSGSSERSVLCERILGRDWSGRGLFVAYTVDADGPDFEVIQGNIVETLSIV
jgi:hypothetical protein